MIRGAARGLFQSARQVRRAAKHKNKRVQIGGRQGETRRTVCDVATEESVITSRQKQTFGRARYIEAMPRVLASGVGMLDVGAIDALNGLLQDLAEEDDDGR